MISDWSSPLYTSNPQWGVFTANVPQNTFRTVIINYNISFKTIGLPFASLNGFHPSSGGGSLNLTLEQANVSQFNCCISTSADVGTVANNKWSALGF